MELKQSSCNRCLQCSFTSLFAEVEVPDVRKEKDGATPPVSSSPSTPDYAAGLLTTSQVR